MRKHWMQQIVVAMLSCVAGAAAWGGATTMPSKAPASLPADTEFAEPESLAPPSTAQPSKETPELEFYTDLPVVVAAGKREQTQREAAASVSVITSDDIQLYGYRSLADALRTQRGFYLNTDGLNWFLGVRGFLRPDEWNARILVLVDGRPTREMLFNQTHVDQDFVVPMEAVDRIEVIRGPGSALYGADAVFGVINVVTKSGADIDGVQAKLEGGTQWTGRVNALFGYETHDGWDIMGDVSGSTSQGDNHLRFDGVNDAAHYYGNIVNSDYAGVYSGFLKIRKGEFSATFDSESRDQDNADATYLAEFFNPGSMQEARTNATFKFDHEISSNQELHAMTYYGDYNYHQHWAYDAEDDIYNTTAYDNWIGEEVDYDWQATKQFHLLAGANATQAIGTHQQDYTSNAGTVLNTRLSYNDAGAFIEGEDKITSWLDVTVGGRVDQVQRVGTSFSPRAAVILTPTATDTFKILYGRAFRPPNIYEMFYSDPGANTPNPNLNPEICDTYELEWERQFADGWRTTLDGYIWQLHHAINDVELPDGSEQYQNQGTDLARGLEAQLDKKWKSGATFRLYGSVDRAERDGDGLTHSPQWIVGLSAAAPILNNHTFLSVEPQVVGSMTSDLGQSTHPTYITNVVLTSRDVMKGMDFQLGLYNLFGDIVRIPRDNQFDQFQSTLRYPYPTLLASVTYKF
ncbi:MAG: TonB-dependent receptor [Tepidisphaeraceae bacterium]